MTMRAYSYSLLLTLLAFAANAGIGPQHTIPAPLVPTQRLSFDTTFDGQSYLLAHTSATGLRIRRIAESGEPIGSAVNMTDEPASSVAIGSNGSGLSLVAWVVPSAGAVTAKLRMAWIDGAGGVGAPFTGSSDARLPWYSLADANNWTAMAVAPLGDQFLVAWPDWRGLNLSRIEPRATAFTSTERAGEYAGVRSLVTNGARALLAWNTPEPFPCGIPEGCSRPALHLSVISSEGLTSSRGEPADRTGTPFPAVTGDVFALNDPAAVVQLNGAGAAIWYIRGGSGSAMLGRQIYAMRMRYLQSGMRDLYFGAAGFDTAVHGEYRYTHTQVVNALVAYPRLAAGAHTVLAAENAVTDFAFRDELTYRVIDLATPFPPLPPAPDALTVMPFVPSHAPAPTSWWQTTVSWPVAGTVDHYFVESEPLSDPSAQYFIGPVPGSVGQGTVNSFEADVLYAIRVYAENFDGISTPAEYFVRTPAAPTPRSAIDFTASVTGDVATFRWRDVSTNESGFRISVCQRICGVIAATGPDATSVTATLLPGSYSYSLETFNAAGSTFAQRAIPIGVAAPRRRALR